MEPGDRVALYAENAPEWILAYLGVHLAGAAIVPLDAQFTSRELQNLLTFAEPHILLYGESCREAAEAVLPETPAHRLIPLDGEHTLFDAAPAGKAHEHRPDELMALIFTSGTTGDPKAVRLTVNNVMSNVASVMECRLIEKDDNVLVLLPFHHIYALNMTILVPFVTGALVIVALPSEQLERMVFLGYEQYFQTRWMQWLGRVFRVVSTATAETVLPSLQRAAEALRRGRSACIFPEGMVSRDGFLQRPRPGAGILACELGVPVVPVLVRGTFETLSFAHRRLRFVPVGLTFGPPIKPPRKERYDNEDYEGFMQEWVEAIAELRRADDASGSRTAGGSPRISEP